MSETILHTIGYVRSPYPEKFGIPRQSGLVDTPGHIELVAPYNDPNALRGLEEFSHIWVLWQVSEAVDAKGNWEWSPTVRPPRLGGNERKGVFATRSPIRPNAIGLSCVRISGIDAEAGIIDIIGADMLDGTPVYDIKPYISYSDSIPDAVNGFSVPPDKCLLEVVFSDGFAGTEKSAGTLPSEEDLRLICDILAQNPRPQYQNDPARVYGMRYKDYNVMFRIDRDRAIIEDITSV